MFAFGGVGGSWREDLSRVPATRFQGSKRKLLGYLGGIFEQIDFDTALDIYSGTGSVSYLLKCMGKTVTSNDYLGVSRVWADALVVNESAMLSEAAVDGLMQPRAGRQYKYTIAENYDGIFFPDNENRWLDVVVQNIRADLSGHERSVALFALTQAALVKRPYNLFHRANLYMRTADVPRSFGNLKTWNRPFEEWFRQFTREVNGAVFASGKRHQAICSDAADVKRGYDLVYLDPPYLNSRGMGLDYQDFYHFLEGLIDYDVWTDGIDRTRKHRPFRPRESAWSTKSRALKQLALLASRHRDSTLVVSYRSDGQPTLDEIAGLLASAGKTVTDHSVPYKYALSTNRAVKEHVLVAD